MCVLIAAVIMLAACGEADAPARDQEAGAPPVEAVVAREGGLPLQERVSGTVKARNQIAVRSEISAPIVSVMARSGDRVAAGQPLVRLDDTELRAQLRQAEAAVRLAAASAQETRARLGQLESQLNRARALAAERLISAMDLESLEAQVQGARAAVAQADARVEQSRATESERRNALSRTVIRAPAAGHVGQRNAEVGMIAGSDTVLFVLGDSDDLIVEIPLTQEMLRTVSTGDAAIVSAPALGGTTVRGTLARISPFLSNQSFSTTGEVEVPGTAGQLSPGMFVTVDILYGESDRATLVPLSAIWQDPRSGESTVYVVGSLRGEEARSTLEDAPRPIQRRVVEVRAEGGGMAGVSGVQPGEWVVVAGQHLLAEDESTTAHVRTSGWDRILAMQSLQREDILVEFLEKQQSYAALSGSEPPSNEEYLRGRGATPQERKVN